MLNFKIAECIETGMYHEVAEHVCQDAVGKYENEECAAVALCDGAGSFDNSELDSQFVCEHLPKFLAESFDELYNMEDDYLIDVVLNNIETYKNYCELNCTMLAVCMHKDGRCIALHVGDGMIFGEDEDGWRLVSDAENGSESYITFFLSGEAVSKHLRVSRDACKSFFLTSDGLSDLFYSNHTVMNAVPVMVDWLKNFSEEDVEEKYRQEMQELFSSRTQDDMSIAAITKALEIGE